MLSDLQNRAGEKTSMDYPSTPFSCNHLFVFSTFFSVWNWREKRLSLSGKTNSLWEMSWHVKNNHGNFLIYFSVCSLLHQQRHVIEIRFYVQHAAPLNMMCESVTVNRVCFCMPTIQHKHTHTFIHTLLGACDGNANKPATTHPYGMYKYTRINSNQKKNRTELLMLAIRTFPNRTLHLTHIIHSDHIIWMLWFISQIAISLSSSFAPVSPVHFQSQCPFLYQFICCKSSGVVSQAQILNDKSTRLRKSIK